MRIAIIVVVALLLPFATSAMERVAVLPVSYTMYKTNAPSEERALKVSEAVAVGVERAGLEPLRGDEVTAASRELAGEGASYCDQPSCAKEVAKQVGAAFAIFVSVLDKDGQFEIKVLGTDSEPITASPFGTFRSMTRRVSGLVETSIREAVSANPAPVATEEPPEEIAEGPPEAEQDDSGQSSIEDEIDPASAGEAESEKGLSPAPFIVSAALTGALAAGYVSVEVIGYTREKDNEANKNDRDYNPKETESLRLTSRILLGCGAAGLVTTVVLFFLTDFNDDDEQAPQTSKWTLVPTPTANGGGLVLEGRF